MERDVLIALGDASERCPYLELKPCGRTSVRFFKSRPLEQPVTNLTLSDDVVRSRIRVGVAYGSATRDVEKVIMQVLSKHDAVKRDPEPQVRFEDFGDSALVFDALFWISISDRREVESELRHRLAEAFEKSGIVMAFPQRDVHLSTSRPLQIQVTSSPEAAGAEKNSRPMS